jgi:ankyrin repeat protein
MEVVDFLLEHGARLNYGTPLHRAARRLNQKEGAELIERLVRRGLDVNCYEWDNDLAFVFRGGFLAGMPLHAACRGRNVSVARELIRHGASPHKSMRVYGQPKAGSPTPAEIAKRTGDSDLLKALHVD